jgi:hypothetical protein
MHTTSSPDGATLAFDRTGDGPALVIVGGAFGTRDHPSVIGLAQHLAGHATVYRYDRRGRGDSTDTAGLEALAPTLVYDNAVMGDDNALPVAELGTIARPVLVLSGELSPDWFHRAAAATAAACPDARHQRLPGQSHFAPDEAAVAAAVGAFLRS